MRFSRILAGVIGGGLLLLISLLSGPAGIGPEPQSAEAALAEVLKLTASDAQASVEFGFSVAVDGDTAVVGAFRESAGGSNAGAAYVFGRNEGGADNWGEVKKLTASDAQGADLFGWSVAVDGDTAVVGAHLEDAGGNAAGAAYVFGRNEGGADNWGEVAKLTASDAQGNDRFGWSVAVDGDTAVVGAYLEDTAANNAGAVYVFGRNESGADNWGEVAKLTASDAQG
ncbi:MAG: FG-GAP repeat protein, partial [Chloroflexi bacterium]|nr:FG-GAP repeat protein [Chloroflexota bacterium]